MIIAFPPCTHLAVSGARHFEQKRKDGRQQQGIDFFMEFVNADCPRIAIENPIGIMSSKYRKPDQIIQPWMFGDKYTKSTCLWLKGLPKLKPTNIVEHGDYFEWVDKNGKKKRQPKWFFEALKNAKTPDEKMKAKDFLNFSIGCLQNHNWMFRTCILSYANKIITDLIEKYDEHVIYCNTDNITLDIPIELDIGKGIGQFKVEHDNEYVKKKGSAIQWENKLIYRGITSSRLKDDFDLLTDELTYTKPTKYKFNSEELRIDENN